jgi:hypothetical protein
MVVRLSYVSPDGRVVKVVHVFPGPKRLGRAAITAGSVSEHADQRTRRIAGRAK